MASGDTKVRQIKAHANAECTSGTPAAILAVTVVCWTDWTRVLVNNVAAQTMTLNLARHQELPHAGLSDSLRRPTNSPSRRISLGSKFPSGMFVNEGERSGITTKA
jgi:hypothetical protein